MRTERDGAWLKKAVYYPLLNKGLHKPTGDAKLPWLVSEVRSIKRDIDTYCFTETPQDNYAGSGDENAEEDDSDSDENEVGDGEESEEEDIEYSEDDAEGEEDVQDDAEEDNRAASQSKEGDSTRTTTSTAPQTPARQTPVRQTLTREVSKPPPSRSTNGNGSLEELIDLVKMDYRNSATPISAPIETGSSIISFLQASIERLERQIAKLEGDKEPLERERDSLEHENRALIKEKYDAQLLAASLQNHIRFLENGPGGQILPHFSSMMPQNEM